jgi:hypothetical protein
MIITNALQDKKPSHENDFHFTDLSSKDGASDRSFGSDDLFEDPDEKKNPIEIPAPIYAMVKKAEGHKSIIEEAKRQEALEREAILEKERLEA